ncbi:MAG: glycosyltransferase family 4 protein [Chloroflexi bacterium]|nr:glycosyltransferase family 4 protein [Chloroflexota bacterium]
MFVGRLASNKGLPILLDALEEVATTHPDLSATILGSGPLGAWLDDQLAKRGLAGPVRRLQRVDSAQDVANLYQSARMLVCASTAEGGPRVTVEAMACATPVISTPVGVMAELIEHGENGLLFEWDSSQLARHIAYLLDHPAEAAHIGAAGHASVQGFHAANVIQRYAEGYQTLVRQRQG